MFQNLLNINVIIVVKKKKIRLKRHSININHNCLQEENVSDFFNIVYFFSLYIFGSYTVRLQSIV